MTRIVVIEDENSIRENIVQILEFEDYEVLDAPNGLLGLQLIEESLPALIICDVHMPELDGYEVITRVRNNPATQSIPFLFLTGRVDPDGIQHGLDLGANGYIKKPFLPSDILDAIRSHLDL